MSKTYFNSVIPLAANQKKIISVNNGSSFVLNTGTSNIICKVNGKSFRLRESQVNDHSDENFTRIELTSDITQTIDIRFGTNGMVVSPPQKEFVNLAGDIVTDLDPGAIQAIADANELNHVSKVNEDLTDVTISTHASNVTTLAVLDNDVLKTLVQRIDSNSGSCRVGGNPATDRGTEMISQDVRTYDGGGAVSVFNNSGADVTFSISREKKA